MNKNLKLIIVGVGGQGILTVSEVLGTAAILEGVKAVMRKAGLKVTTVKALELAKQAGSTMAGNIVMLGAMASLKGFIFSKESILEALKKKINPKMRDINVKAFELGYSAGKAS